MSFRVLFGHAVQVRYYGAGHIHVDRMTSSEDIPSEPLPTLLEVCDLSTIRRQASLVNSVTNSATCGWSLAVTRWLFAESSMEF